MTKVNGGNSGNVPLSIASDTAPSGPAIKAESKPKVSQLPASSQAKVPPLPLTTSVSQKTVDALTQTYENLKALKGDLASIDQQIGVAASKIQRDASIEQKESKKSLGELKKGLSDLSKLKQEVMALNTRCVGMVDQYKNTLSTELSKDSSEAATTKAPASNKISFATAKDNILATIKELNTQIVKLSQSCVKYAATSETLNLSPLMLTPEQATAATNFVLRWCSEDATGRSMLEQGLKQNEESEDYSHIAAGAVEKIKGISTNEQLEGILAFAKTFSQEIEASSALANKPVAEQTAATADKETSLSIEQRTSAVAKRWYQLRPNFTPITNFFRNLLSRFSNTFEGVSKAFAKVSQKLSNWNQQRIAEKVEKKALQTFQNVLRDNTDEIQKEFTEVVSQKTVDQPSPDAKQRHTLLQFIQEKSALTDELKAVKNKDDLDVVNAKISRLQALENSPFRAYSAHEIETLEFLANNEIFKSASEDLQNEFQKLLQSPEMRNTTSHQLHEMFITAEKANAILAKINNLNNASDFTQIAAEIAQIKPKDEKIASLMQSKIDELSALCMQKFYLQLSAESRYDFDVMQSGAPVPIAQAQAMLIALWLRDTKFGKIPQQPGGLSASELIEIRNMVLQYYPKNIPPESEKHVFVVLKELALVVENMLDSKLNLETIALSTPIGVAEDIEVIKGNKIEPTITLTLDEVKQRLAKPGVYQTPLLGAIPKLIEDAEKNLQPVENGPPIPLQFLHDMPRVIIRLEGKKYTDLSEFRNDMTAGGISQEHQRRIERFVMQGLLKPIISTIIRSSSENELIFGLHFVLEGVTSRIDIDTSTEPPTITGTSVFNILNGQDLETSLGTITGKVHITNFMNDDPTAQDALITIYPPKMLA